MKLKLKLLMLLMLMIQKGTTSKSVCHDSLLYQITKTTQHTPPGGSQHSGSPPPRSMGRCEANPLASWPVANDPFPSRARRRAGLRSRWHPSCKPSAALSADGKRWLGESCHN